MTRSLPDPSLAPFDPEIERTISHLRQARRQLAFGGGERVPTNSPTVPEGESESSFEEETIYSSIDTTNSSSIHLVICIFLGMFVAMKDKPSEGFTGLSWETIKDNWSSDYQKTNDAGIPETDGHVSWNFNSLVCLFFPAVTGIMAALRSLRSLRENQVHPKNWYPIPLVFCRPWGQLPENVPCHPKLADFANCMKKKGRGMSIFVSILDGDYHECAEDAKSACKQLTTYINYKNCEGMAEIVVAPNMSKGFRGIVQTMGLGNLKPNIVVMRYPEIWRWENLTEIPKTFVGIFNDCIVANKAVVIVKGLDEWPNEYQKQYGTIDLYWIKRMQM
ncbi:hypothetical protein AHAS_Ahas13G0170600 [Arachis hypogaea]